MAIALPRLILFTAVSLFSIYLGFFATTPEQSEKLYITFGYWNIAALFAGFVFSVGYGSREAIASWLRNRRAWTLISVSLIGALFLYSRDGGSFKVVFDEQLLSLVAKSFHQGIGPVVKESTLIGNASYEMIDKRPLLFPFLLSLVHDVFGYRVENAFYLNFALTATFLLLLGSLVNRIAGRTAGYFAIVLACLFPLIEQNASGGGFEILNLCGILTATWLGIKYLESPSNIALTRLALSLALLSHIRYESVLMALPFAAIVAYQWIRDRSIKLTYPLALLPLSFLTLAWQLAYIRTQAGFWQYSLKGDSSFDISYFAFNIRHAADFLFLPSDRYASAPVIGILGVCATLGIIAFSITRRKQLFEGRLDRMACIAGAIGILLQTLLVMCFTFGQLDDILVSRLGLPLVLLLIINTAILLGYFFAFPQKFAKPLCFFVVALAASTAFTSYSTRPYTTKNVLRDRIELTLEFAHGLPEGTYLFICDTPRSLELEGFNNISIASARERLENIAKHIELMTYDDVFVIQYGAVGENGDTVEKSLMPKSELGPQVKLETILERSLLALNFTRISRITGFDWDAPAWQAPANPNSGEPRMFKLITPEEVKEWKRSLP